MAKKIDVAGELNAATVEGMLGEAEQIHVANNNSNVEQELSQVLYEGEQTDKPIVIAEQTNADFATKALQDSEGRVIKNTYTTNANLGIPTFDVSKAYNIGDVVFNETDGKYYKFIQNHAVGAWNSSQVEEYTIKEEFDKNFNDIKKVFGKTTQYCTLRDSFILDTQNKTFKLSNNNSDYIFTINGSFMIQNSNTMIVNLSSSYEIIYLLEDLSAIGSVEYSNVSNIPANSYVIALIEHYKEPIYAASSRYIIDGVLYSYTAFNTALNTVNRHSNVSSYAACLNRIPEIIDNEDNTVIFTVYGVIQYGFDYVNLQGSPEGKSIIFSKANFVRVLLNKDTLELCIKDWSDAISENELLLLQFGSGNTICYVIGGSYKRNGEIIDVASIQTDVASIQTDVASIQTDVASIQTDVSHELTLRDTLYIFTEKSEESETNYIGFTNYWFCFWEKMSRQFAKTKVALPETFYSNFFVAYVKKEEMPLTNGEWPIYIDLYNVALANKQIIVLAIFANGTPIYMLGPTLTDNIKSKSWNRYQNLSDFNSALTRISEIEKKTGLSSTSLKYAEIGDSITFLADNKYETSYDDRGSTKTGYKGWGYGRYLCNALGISYNNHYPQGANGRTFCDYLDEWNSEHWTFPTDIDIWTIFLGTNDWGTERHGLGTKDDYLNDTYTSNNRTTYGAIRKIIDKIRGLSTKEHRPKIIFMTPLQRGCFVYGNTEAIAKNSFMKSAIIKNSDGQWEYTKNSYNFTLEDVVNAIKWVCEYESFECVDLFSNSIVDKSFLNMSQTLEECGWSATSTSGNIYQNVLYDNLHPTAKGFKIIGSRLIEQLKNNFYDIVAVQS